MNNEKSENLDHVYHASIVIEADTPLSNSSGESNILTDSVICRDANQLPIVMGTSLCGIVRHALGRILTKEEVDNIFGFQNEAKDGDGLGSRIIFSHAHIVDENQQTIEGLHPKANWSNYLCELEQLPIRQHCRINEYGVADKENHGKFDSQIVPKGVRFKFSIELMGTEADQAIWQKIIQALASPSFRIGGGTRKGFGKIKIISELSHCCVFQLPQNLDDYLEATSSLNEKLKNAQPLQVESANENEWQKYLLSIAPRDTWLFSSGYSDDNADIIPVYEKIVTWNNGNPQFSEQKILVPATSVKGAIAHRTAYHYNRLSGVFADKIEDFKQHVGENNKAVKALFGTAKDSHNKDEQGQIGCAIFSDIFIDKTMDEQFFEHVSIDSFTGGGIDGALFNEKVLVQPETFHLEIYVDTNAFVEEKIKEAFECALKDIATGYLPLGGGTMRGHGFFSGCLHRDEEKLV